MSKYQNAKIYKIIGGDECYIGSTCEKYLSNRMSGHRKSYRLFLDKKAHFITSYSLFEKYGLENCYIELIENFPCESIEQLRKKEGDLIRTTKCVNKFISGRTYGEWREDNPTYNKDYYESNKEEIAIKQQIYAQKNKETIAKYNKQWREKNKVEVSQKKKEYAKKTKERDSQKIVCECGSEIRKAEKTHHLKSLKHQGFVLSKVTL
jgi:hypothetical protein